MQKLQKGIWWSALLVLAACPCLAEAPGIIQLQFESRPLTAGESGDLTIRFEISEGFKIPKRPSPKLEFSASSDFEVRGDLRLMEEGTGKDPDYFNALKPLSVQLIPSRSAVRGQHWLEGKFVYFYCSEKDKYCSRSVKNLRIPVEVAYEK